jgi:tRNA-dihydrouridine synthase
MLTIHGRTRKEMSEVPAHWDVIGQVRELRDKLAPETLIVGNGDVENRAEALELAKTYQLDGIMIGRGIFHDPFAFAELSPWLNYTKQGTPSRHPQPFLQGLHKRLRRRQRAPRTTHGRQIYRGIGRHAPLRSKLDVTEHWLQRRFKHVVLRRRVTLWITASGKTDTAQRIHKVGYLWRQ